VKVDTIECLLSLVRTDMDSARELKNYSSENNELPKHDKLTSEENLESVKYDFGSTYRGVSRRRKKLAKFGRDGWVWYGQVFPVSVWKEIWSGYEVV
jgi:hypothetical protein